MLKLRIIFIFLMVWIGLQSSVFAQSNVCLIHDHSCIYHGIGRLAGVEPTTDSTLTATANWDQNNDFDLNAQLPTSEQYSDPEIALPWWPLQSYQPFFPNATGSHIYPNHYSSEINNGEAQALHSGDDGGGLATRPDQPNCAIQTSVSCEEITISGNVPSGVYSYILHAFPDSGTSFPETNYELEINATGNMVLVMEDVSAASLTGIIEGANESSNRIDVFALNVGNSGHVGSVTIPQIEYVPNVIKGSHHAVSSKEMYFGVKPPIFAQIDAAFRARDTYATQLEQQRQTFIAEQRRLARLRAEAERKRIAALKEKLIEEQQKHLAALSFELEKISLDQEIYSTMTIREQMAYDAFINGGFVEKAKFAFFVFADETTQTVLSLGKNALAVDLLISDETLSEISDEFYNPNSMGNSFGEGLSYFSPSGATKGTTKVAIKSVHKKNKNAFENIANRDKTHHMNEYGFDPAVLDKSSNSSSFKKPSDGVKSKSTNTNSGQNTGGGALWSSSDKLTSSQTAFKHWKDHKSKFPELQNATQYVKAAKEFLKNPPAGTLTKIRSNGDIVRYNPNTNTFGVMAKDGTPRTMFRPKAGIKYWDKQ